MFNVWLPSVLESRQGDEDNAIQAALKEYVMYAAAGCPGSVVSGELRLMSVHELTPRWAHG